MTLTLRKLFLSLQTQLAAKLQTNRDVIVHQGEKGAATEEGWRTMLEDYLPSRYKVSKAFVIDSLGNFSEQIDLVIYDRQYSPFLFNQDGALYIPAESVYAVFEVKQDLSSAHLAYATGKAASVRKLRRTSAPIVHAGGVIKEPRAPFPILAGLVCLACGGLTEFGDTFRSKLQGAPAEGRLDLVCALSYGTAEITYTESGLTIQESTAETALIFFFLRLLDRLQALGTAPAMVLGEYLKALES